MRVEMKVHYHSPLNAKTDCLREKTVVLRVTTDPAEVTCAVCLKAPTMALWFAAKKAE